MEYNRRRAGRLTVILVLGVWLGYILWLPAGAADRALRIVDSAGKLVGLYEGSYALVIGVSDYTNGWPDLPGVKDDMAAVSALLKEQGFEVMVVQDPDQRGLREAFDRFISRYGLSPEARLLIYYAGHGHTLTQSYKEDMGYIVPTDAPNPNQDRNGFLSAALDMQQIEVYAKRIQSKHVLFLFDSCFSGSIFSLSRAVPEYISAKTSQPVRQFITAGGKDEKVPDESVFRRQFQAALRGEGDTNHDGYVTGSELGEFLSNKVINYSKRSQNPQYGKIRNPNLDKGDFVFKITVTISQTPGQEPQVEVSTTSGDRDISGLEQRLLEKLDEMRQQGKAADPEVEMWSMVKESPHADDVKTFLETYPKGQFAPAARLRLQQLQRQERQAALPPPAPPAERLRPPTPRKEVAGPEKSEPEPVTPAEPTVTSPYPRSQIQRAQRLLKQVGLDPGPADGMFGTRTEDALRLFQASHGLPVTGQPDEATERALLNEENKRLQEQRQREAEQRQREAEQRQQARLREPQPAAPEPAPARPRTEVQVDISVPPAKPKPTEASGKTLRNSLGMEFVLIPAGEFTMGTYDGLPYEQPVHKVRLSRPFYLGKYEVTQAQWMELMGSNPSYFVNLPGEVVAAAGPGVGGAANATRRLLDRPVDRVSWNQVQEFIRRLNAKEGHEKYRLPTEAEWEYAARAGTPTRYSFGDDESKLGQYGWCLQNAGGKTQPVGQLKPNAWGLYDMEGNILEWVLDWWAPNYPAGQATDPQGVPTGTLKVLRGGSWAHVARQCRVAERLFFAPVVAHTTTGFRLLRTAP